MEQALRPEERDHHLNVLLSYSLWLPLYLHLLTFELFREEILIGLHFSFLIQVIAIFLKK